MKLDRGQTMALFVFDENDSVPSKLYQDCFHVEISLPLRKAR